MQLFKITYQTDKLIYKKGRVRNEEIEQTFYRPEKPAEISFLSYQSAVQAVKDMPMFCKVILKFVEIDDIPATKRQDNFMIARCSDVEKAQVYASVKNILLHLFKKKVIAYSYKDADGTPAPDLERFEPVSGEDLAFLDLPNIAELVSVNTITQLLKTIFYDISDAFILKETAEASSAEEAQEIIEGKQIFKVPYTDKATQKVVNRIFYLPIEKLKAHYEKIVINTVRAAKKRKFKAGEKEPTTEELKTEALSKEVRVSEFPNYNSWDATTALSFSQQQSEGNVPPAVAIAAQLAALCLEVETLNPFTIKPKPQRSLEQLEADTRELIGLFQTHLNMYWAHQINFFLRYTERQFITATT